ncbi:MAG: YfcE family phosphodiesterase [Anaerolineaceae bacterium]|nr:YfcE family phosphodiesterase [Anaerolineaceae bacterium]
MLIGILSDTHNNLANLATALALFEREGVSTLVHCGDFTNVEIASKMAGFQVIGVFGNGDFASGEIREVLLRQNPENYAGLEFSGRIGDARIAVTHGHIPGRIEELVHAGGYDYVFKGHSHSHKDERFGMTRLINPGALGGMHREERRVCLLDTYSGKANFIKIQNSLGG